MTDLYEILGVAKDATSAELRRAYRAAAKRAHPDGGGSVDKFALVRTAIETLGDDKRRAHYDRTGEIGDKPVDQGDTVAMTIVMNAVDRVLREIERRGARIEEYDVVKDAIINLNADRMALLAKIANTCKAAENVRKLAKRFKVKRGKPNRILAMFEARADEMERQAAHGAEEKMQIERALEILADHSFDVELRTYRTPGGIVIGGFILNNTGST